MFIDQQGSLEGDIHLKSRVALNRHNTHHGNSVWGKQLLGAHGGDVGYVGKDVNKGHEGDGDEDGTWKVPS